MLSGHSSDKGHFMVHPARTNDESQVVIGQLNGYRPGCIGGDLKIIEVELESVICKGKILRQIEGAVDRAESLTPQIILFKHLICVAELLFSQTDQLFILLPVIGKIGEGQ